MAKVTVHVSGYVCAMVAIAIIIVAIYNVVAIRNWLDFSFVHFVQLDCWFLGLPTVCTLHASPLLLILMHAMTTGPSFGGIFGKTRPFLHQRMHRRGRVDIVTTHSCKLDCSYVIGWTNVGALLPSQIGDGLPACPKTSVNSAAYYYYYIIIIMRKTLM